MTVFPGGRRFIRFITFVLVRKYNYSRKCVRKIGVVSYQHMLQNALPSILACIGFTCVHRVVDSITNSCPLPDDTMRMGKWFWVESEAGSYLVSDVSEFGTVHFCSVGYVGYLSFVLTC